MATKNNNNQPAIKIDAANGERKTNMVNGLSFEQIIRITTKKIKKKPAVHPAALK